MKKFISYSRREVARLKREAKTLAIQGDENQSLEKLDLAEEIETAAAIVRDALKHAITLNYISALK